MKLRPLSMFLVLVLAFTGCDTLTGGSDEVTITIAEGTSLAIALRDSAALTVKDEAGNTITADQLSWSSADPSIATVTSTGQVTAEKVGTTTVTAQLGESDATIEIVVTFEAAANQMLIDVTGDFEALYEIEAFGSTAGDMMFAMGLEVNFLDRPTWDFGYIFGERWSETSATGAGIFFALPDNIAAGSYALQSAPEDFSLVDLTDLSSPLALFYREAAGGVYYVYFPTQGTLQVSAVQIGGTDFEPSGTVEGSASFPAAEYEESYNETTGEWDYTATGGTVQVEVVFKLPAAAYQAGSMDLSASGGPYPSATSVVGWADAWYNPSSGLGMDVWDVLSSGAEVYADMQIFDPAVSTFQIPGDAATYWYESMGTSYMDATGESGTITLSEFTAPTSTTYGVARGSVDLTYRVDEFSDRSGGEAFTVTGTFAIPVAPETLSGAAGGAQVAADGAARSPLTRPLPEGLVPASWRARTQRSAPQR